MHDIHHEMHDNFKMLLRDKHNFKRTTHNIFLT